MLLFILNYMHKVVYGQKVLQLEAQYFQGTNYRLYSTNETGLLVRVYDQGQERVISKFISAQFLRTELQAIQIVRSHPNILSA